MGCMALRLLGTSEEFRRSERETLRSHPYYFGLKPEIYGGLYSLSQRASNTTQF